VGCWKAVTGGDIRDGRRGDARDSTSGRAGASAGRAEKAPTSRACVLANAWMRIAKWGPRRQMLTDRPPNTCAHVRRTCMRPGGAGCCRLPSRSRARRTWSALAQPRPSRPRVRCTGKALPQACTCCADRPSRGSVPRSRAHPAPAWLGCSVWIAAAHCRAPRTAARWPG
jgi:hypothetical protein